MYRNIKLIFESDLGNPPRLLKDEEDTPTDGKFWMDYIDVLGWRHRLKIVGIKIEQDGMTYREIELDGSDYRLGI